MQNNTNNGRAFLATVVSAAIMTTVCGIIIFSLNKVGADTVPYRPAILGFLGVGLFFIPVLFAFYFFYRDKHLATQCAISGGIAVVELGLFLSTQHMAKTDALFLTNLLTIALGATALPLVYRLFVKDKGEG